MQKPLMQPAQVNGSICSRPVLVLHFHRLGADRDALRGSCGADSGMHTRVRAAVGGREGSAAKAGRLVVRYMCRSGLLYLVVCIHPLTTNTHPHMHTHCCGWSRRAAQAHLCLLTFDPIAFQRNAAPQRNAAAGGPNGSQHIGT